MTDYELIEEYLNGNLPPETHSEVQLRLKTDPAFAELFRLYQMMEEDMHVDEKEKNLRATLGEIRDASTTPVVKISTWQKRKWWLVAGAAAVVALVFLLMPTKPMSDQELLTAYAIQESLPGATRGTEDSLRIAAAKLYNNKNYADALPLLDSLRQRFSTDAALTMATGVCYMNTGKTDKALALFDSLATGQSAYKYQALLWKGFVFLKKGQRDSCFTTLQRIPPSTDVSKTADEIIQKSGWK